MITIKNFALVLLVLAANNINAQTDQEKFLASVKNNNKSLIAAKNITKASQLEAKTGITPENPELEFGYFPGNTDDIGTKQVIGISQSLEFPSTYIYKSKIANTKNTLADIEYKKIEMQVLLEATKAFKTAIYLNKMAINYTKRTAEAQQMVEFYLKKQTNGDATQLEVNKAKLFLISLQNHQRLNNSYQKRNSELIKELNGGNEYLVVDTIFSIIALKDWITIQHEIDSLLPELQAFEAENKNAQLNLKLNKSAWLPNIMVGYESEEILGEKYSGIKAGVTIPLWENKNTVKQAKARILANKSNQDHIKLNKVSIYHAYFIECETLQENLSEFKASLDEMNNEYLLSRSLELGQISAIEYFMELDYFYDIMDELFALEYQYQISLADLYSYKN